MRKALILAAAVAMVTFGAGLAVAGEYHQSTQLVCSDCHTMHASQQHVYGADTAPSTTSWNSGAGFDKLLKASSANALCLTCHNATSGTPDVFETDTNTTGSGGRQGGALNDTLSSGTYDQYMGHTLGNVGVPPGGSGSITLTCAECHNPHGTAKWRNLRDADYNSHLFSAADLTYTVSTTAENTNWIRVNLGSVPAVGSRISGGFYSRDNIYFNEPTTTESEYGDFCAACHGNFHGTTNTNASSPFVKHPTEAVNFTSGIATEYISKTAKVQVMMASNSSTVTYDTTASPTCVTCHKAHGNTNSFGLIFQDAAESPRTESGGGTLRDLCGQCHTQSGL